MHSNILYQLKIDFQQLFSFIYYYCRVYIYVIEYKRTYIHVLYIEVHEVYMDSVYTNEKHTNV